LPESIRVYIRLFANLEVFEAGLKAHLLATRVLHKVSGIYAW